MNIVANNSNPPVTLTHLKGNDFSAEFDFSGAGVIALPVGRVSRMDDPASSMLIEFKTVDNSAIVSGTKISLSKTDSSILIPKGVYAFELEATVDGVRDRVIKNSFFIVE